MADVLAVTSQLPWPLDAGGHLRTFHLLRSLAGRWPVRLVVPAPAGQGAAVDALRGAGIDVRPVPVGPRVGWREALRAASAAARGEPYVFYRRHGRRAVRAALAAEARRGAPGLLYLDHLDAFVYRSALPRVPCLIDLHNVYSILARRAADGRGRLGRAYLGREATLLERVERRASRAADLLTAVSEEDGQVFRGLGARAVRVVPNGVDCAAYGAMPCGRRARPPLILYVGTMSWEPNARAARLLATEVLPRVRRVHPEARVRIVGRDPTPEVRALGTLPGVEVTGRVHDVGSHLRDAGVLAVPLEAGGGTRLKILEAFAAGLPVVSTPVGCEGLGAQPGEHLIVAPLEALAQGILSLLADEALGDRLAARARALARERYDWSSVGAAACDAAAELLRPHPRIPATA